MARRPNLRCHCQAFEMIDDEHVIEHGHPGKSAKHTATACDADPLLPKKKPAQLEPRRFRLGVTK